MVFVDYTEKETSDERDYRSLSGNARRPDQTTIKKYFWSQYHSRVCYSSKILVFMSNGVQIKAPSFDLAAFRNVCNSFNKPKARFH